MVDGTEELEETELEITIEVLEREIDKVIVGRTEELVNGVAETLVLAAVPIQAQALSSLAPRRAFWLSLQAEEAYDGMAMELFLVYEEQNA